MAPGNGQPVSSQAADMIRRVSPEGRERARREREARQRATRQLTGRVALAALVVAVVALLVDRLASPLGTTGPVVALLVFVAASAAIVRAARRRPIVSDALATTALDRLPGHARDWLEGRRPALPPAGMPLLDTLSAHLDELAPQLARLDPHAPAADAVRRLLATDLPALVTGYQSVPPSLRTRPGATGRSADTQLIDGLAIIDAEVQRMSGQLARGALDDLATQGRFLETKYEGSADLA